MKPHIRYAQCKQITLITLIIILGIGYGVQDAGYREETEIEIIKAPRIAQINPYQTEYEKLLYPTVRITAGWSTGTGVIISNTNDTNKDEWTRIVILTAAHVVGDETTVNIELYNSTVITAAVVITDTVKDLALIRVICGIRDIRVKDIYSARLAPRDYTPYLFTPVWAVGCSLGLKPRPSYGHITSIEDSTLNAPRSTLHWEVSCPILPGNSGGPVYDARTYEVIGIAVWVKVYNGQLVTTMAGVVPINQIHEFLNETTNGH